MSNTQADRLADILSFAPNFGCATNEPSVSDIIHRYYQAHFTRKKAEALSAQYIAALAKQQASPPSAPQAAGAVPVMTRAELVAAAESIGMRFPQVREQAALLADEVVHQVGELVGMHHGAWDMVSASELVGAFSKVLAAESEALALLAELRKALAATYSLSPEGQAYLARMDAALAQGTTPAAGVGGQATVNACKLTECQGQPRCRYCVAKDAREAQAEPMSDEHGLESAADYTTRLGLAVSRDWADGWDSCVRAILAEAQAATSDTPPQPSDELDVHTLAFFVHHTLRGNLAGKGVVREAAYNVVELANMAKKASPNMPHQAIDRLAMSIKNGLYGYGETDWGKRAELKMLDELTDLAQGRNTQEKTNG